VTTIYVAPSGTRLIVLY